jgi:hypothetical protein
MTVYTTPFKLWHGDFISMHTFKVALNTYLNKQLFYSVDEFLVPKDDGWEQI